MPRPRQLVHREWFDYALQKLGDLPRVDSLLAEEFYRLATYADLVSLAPGCEELRLYPTVAHVSFRLGIARCPLGFQA